MGGAVKVVPNEILLSTSARHRECYKVSPEKTEEDSLKQSKTCQESQKIEKPRNSSVEKNQFFASHGYNHRGFFAPPCKKPNKKEFFSSQTAPETMARDVVLCDCLRRVIAIAIVIVCVQAGNFLLFIFVEAYFLIVFLLCTRDPVASHMLRCTTQVCIFLFSREGV